VGKKGRICKSQRKKIMVIAPRRAPPSEAGMKSRHWNCRPGIKRKWNRAFPSPRDCAAMFRAGGETPAVMPLSTSGHETMMPRLLFWKADNRSRWRTVFWMGGCYRRIITVANDAQQSVIFRRAVGRHVINLSGINENARSMKFIRVVQPGRTVYGRRLIWCAIIIMDNKLGCESGLPAPAISWHRFPPSWDEGICIS